MKKLFLILTMLSIGFFATPAKSQINVSFNIGSQPSWGPVGYDYVDYYYMPDIDVYYNVPRRQFVYLDLGRWIFSASLPSRYRNYDLYNGYKVVVNRPDAYRYYDDDRVRYANYRNWRGASQVIIRDRPDYRRNYVNYRNSGPSYQNNRTVIVNRDRNYRTRPTNNYSRVVYNDRKNNRDDNRSNDKWNRNESNRVMQNNRNESNRVVNYRNESDRGSQQYRTRPSGQNENRNQDRGNGNRSGNEKGNGHGRGNRK